MKKRSPKKKNRQLILAFFIGIILICNGCGRKETSQKENNEKVNTEETETNADFEEQTGQAQEEAVAENGEVEEEKAAGVQAETSSIREQQIKNTDNETLLTMKANMIYVTVPGNQEAEDAINRFFADRYASWQDTVNTYREMAEQDFETWCAMKSEDNGEEGSSQEGGQEEAIGPGSWNSYELDRTYRVMRADEEIISIVEDDYEYTGGAHGNAVRVAYNFDAQTGKRMTLEEVASDLDEIRQKSVAYLGEKLPESKVAEELFGDYANHLEDILTDSTWYLDRNGLHVICNEYIITPHSAGILDFLLPYEEVDVVKERFQLAG